MAKHVFYDKEGNPVEVHKVEERGSVWVHLIWAAAVVAIVAMLVFGC